MRWESIQYFFKMIFKAVIYFFYMIYARIKGIKYEYIKNKYGVEKATEYATKCIYLWSKFTVNIADIKVVVKGKENIPKGPCLFVGNHTSILDIPIILYSVERQIGFISKKEVLKIPILRYWLPRGKCITLDRQSPRDAVRMINEGVENLKNGYSMVIFPEGTRSKDGKLLPFKKGSFKLATKAKVPIIPIVIDAAFTSYEKEGKFKPSTVNVTICSAIDTKNLTRDKEKTLSDDIKRIINNNLSQQYR